MPSFRPKFCSKMPGNQYKNKPKWLVYLCFCFVFLQSLPAHAQEIQTYKPETEADPESWTKPPIKFGSFLLFSEITVKEHYNDNIYALDTFKESDFITTITPEARLVKSFGRHNVALSASAEGQFYKEFDDENQINYGIALEADLEARHDLNIPVAISHNKEHIKRNDSSQIGAFTRKPIGVLNSKVDAGLIYEPGRFRLEFLSSYLQRRLPDADTSLPTAGVTVIAKDRERDSIKLESTVSYQFHPNWRPMFKLEYAHDDFKRNILTTNGFNGADRDSQTFRAFAGLGFDYKGLIGGNILLGQEYRKYEEPGASSVNGFSAEASLRFAPTRRTSGQLSFDKRSHDDNILLTGVKQTVLEAGLKHDISSRWTGLIDTEYKETDFFSINRSDEEYSAKASLVYNVKKGLSLEGSYAHINRDSSISSASYDQNTIMLGLTHQF